MQRLINIQAGESIILNKDEEDAIQNDFFYDWRHVENDEQIVKILKRLRELKEFQDSSVFRRHSAAHLMRKRKGLPIVPAGHLM